MEDDMSDHYVEALESLMALRDQRNALAAECAALREKAGAAERDEALALLCEAIGHLGDPSAYWGNDRAGSFEARVDAVLREKGAGS